MTDINSALDRFLEAWIQQFARTVEIFNGEKPAITWSHIKGLPPGESDNLLWRRQEFDCQSSFTTWIGAQESTWSALGGLSETSSSSDAKATYLEILTKAHEATAAALSAAGLETVLCRQGEIDGGPQGPVSYAVIGVQIASGELPALVLAFESPAAGALARTSSAARPQSREGVSLAPMLDRLMDLELPVSVALGRTEMTIRDVLKVTSGSLIELDQEVGDYVDLVVHGSVVARGEVVSIKGNYGIRIKEVISRKDRIDLYDRNKRGELKRR